MIFAFSAFFKVSKSTSTPNTFSYPAFFNALAKEPPITPSPTITIFIIFTSP